MNCIRSTKIRVWSGKLFRNRFAGRREALADYLGYSGDLLSIIGKLAAYYAHDFKDRVVLDAVNEIEILSSSLSNKIWLKILVLRELMRG